MAGHDCFVKFFCERRSLMSKIVNVVPNDDYTLTITLGNRHRIIYDLRSRLETVRF